MPIENVSRECIIIKVDNKTVKLSYLKNGLRESTHFSGDMSMVLKVYSLSGLDSMNMPLSLVQALQVSSRGILPFRTEFFGL